MPHFGFAGDRVGYVRVCGVYLAGVSLAVIMFHYVGCDLSHSPYSRPDAARAQKWTGVTWEAQNPSSHTSTRGLSVCPLPSDSYPKYKQHHHPDGDGAESKEFTPPLQGLRPRAFLCGQIVEGGPSGRTYRMPEGKVQVRGRVTPAGSRTLPGREE